MSPQVNRRLRLMVPALVLGLAFGIIMMVVFSPKMAREASDASAQSNSTAVVSERADSTASPVATSADNTTTPQESVATPASTPANEKATSEETTSSGPELSMDGLVVRQHPVDENEVIPSLGGLLDPDKAKMEILFTRVGGGIESITFSNIWETAAAKRQAEAYFAAEARGSVEGYSLPSDDQRFVLRRMQAVPYAGQSIKISLMAASGLQVQWNEGDESVSLKNPLPLLSALYWQSIGPGMFKAEVENAKGELVLEILRRFELGDGFDITLHQRVINHTGRDISVQWQQYGPPNLRPERSRYLDRRRFRFGYEFSSEVDANRMADVIADGDMLLEYGDVVNGDEALFWPNDASIEEGFTLSWFASTSRYFTMAIHPLLSSDGAGDRSLESVVNRIEISKYQMSADDTLIETGLFSPMTGISSGQKHDFSMGIYAGPMASDVLDKKQPYVALNMGGIILYQISGFAACACCTFQWLADLLLGTLALLANHVVFDWGLAIIVLVIIVRFLLHPITRMSQVNMQKFSRKMQALKPELDRLKERCGDDKKKMQQEQMKLMREHGVNPLGMLGCLPMLLQMPIWIALYAGLYFSYELRQQPAFWGFFQLFDGWPFLSDLAAPDHFFYTFQEPHQIWFWHVTGINLLPILLGVFFFLQQKYLTPQTAMSPEQETQQKIMRVMMVIMFPLFLYTAPSGLTLYIMTSSIIGTLEGRHIRKQVDNMDFDAKPKRAAAKTVANRAADGGKTIRDPKARAYAKMMERRQSKGGNRKGRGGKKRG
ncbi:MAG: hypothetical protein CMJ40_05300 [Phycisphaerae bacterium]|nr:hypothetical protein [Phycisphaerae bacterium]